MNTCCNNIYPDEDLRRWENCNSTALANPENYYTKSEVDEIIEDISISGGGITSGEVQSMIDAATEPIEGSVEALSGAVEQLSTDLENKAEKSDIPSLENYYNKTEVNAIADTKLDASAYTPTDLSGYATEQWVNNQGYLTQHQPLKTINNQSLIGDGNITISGGGSADLSNYYNKQEVDNKLDLKANASDALSNVQVSQNGSANYTWLNTNKNGTTGTTGYFGKINGTPMASRFPHEVKNMSLVETSAITSSITSTSTDAQVPSAKATYDALSNKADASNVYTKTEVNNVVNNKFACMTQAEYEALTNKDNNILYLIHE